MIPPKFGSYVHGEYFLNKESREDAYIGVIKDIRDGHTELKIVPNPEVPLYVAKPSCRRNTVKREFADKRELDLYRCPVQKKAEVLFNAINNPGKFRPCFGYVNLRKQLSSPYVYGCDIEYDAHMKREYARANGGEMPSSYTVGSLDIETDVNGTRQIILITYMHSNGETYVGVLKEFYGDHDLSEITNMWEKQTEPELRSKLNAKTLKLYEEKGRINIHLELFEKELDLIKWIFDRIHELKPDFCTIWNMDYDIPYILDRLMFRGVRPETICCHPDVPVKYRVCNYHKDLGKKDDHITDHWSWWHLTDYTRYIDAMCLYGRLRKAKPREPSYKLDMIGGKELGAGKLQFGTGENHNTMQRYHQVEYSVYNIVDVLILHLLELKNTDVYNMCMLCGVSTLDTFSHQSLQLKNMFYDYLSDEGCVPGSIGEPINDPWDRYITNKGGAVLSPERAPYISVPALVEDDAAIRATRFVADCDATAMYPSLMQMLNCSKETKLCTVLHIDNSGRRGIVDVNTVIPDKEIAPPGYMTIPVMNFFANAIYVESNAIAVGQMFGLPDFAGIDEYMKSRSAAA